MLDKQSNSLTNKNIPDVGQQRWQDAITELKKHISKISESVVIKNQQVLESYNLGENLMDQCIAVQVAVAASTTSAASVTIPTGADVYLIGYGYQHIAGLSYSLDTGNTLFPSRTDQEGSILFPRYFKRPFPCRSGSTVKLNITNPNATTYTNDVVFYFLTSQVIQQSSTGRDSQIFEPQVPVHSAVSVGTSSGTALAANTARHSALFVNDSSNVIWLNVAGATAVANTGIRLNASGGSYYMSYEEGNLNTGLITAIAAGASSNLLVTEYT